MRFGQGQEHVLFFFARHGTTDLNKQNIFRGQEDVDLDKQGVREAMQLGHWMKGLEIGMVFSSDRRRSIHTAQILSSQAGLDKPMPIKALAPWDIGYLTGKPKKEHVQEIQYFVENPSAKPRGGESLTSFRDRIKPILAQAIELRQMTGAPPCIVGHSSVLYEIGQIFENDHNAALVKPAGLAAVFIKDGVMHATAIFKPGEDDTSFAHTHTTPS